MKFLTLCLILTCAVLFSASAQHPNFSTIKSRDGILSPSIQSFAVGDSLFIFFLTAGKKNFNSLLILPDGEQKSLDLPELKNKAIAGIIPRGYNLDFYYFDDSKSTVSINSFSLHRHSLNKSAVSSKSIPGRVIGYETNDSLNVITYDERKSLIYLQRFAGGNKVFENHYRANAQLFKDKVTFISRYRITEPSDADGDIKIHLDAKYLWIIAENNENKTMGTCSVFKIDLLNGKTVNKGIFDYSGQKWNTMLCGDKILKVSKMRGITLEVYDFEKSQPIFSTTLAEGSEISKRSAYERRGASNEVFPIDVQQSLKAWGRPVVIPTVIRHDSILLQIGNHEPTIMPKGVGLPNLGSIFELSRIASYLVNQKVSVDRYFYLQGNFTDGFSYKPDPIMLIKKIDDFEMSDRDKPLYVNFKGYVLSKKAAFGI